MFSIDFAIQFVGLNNSSQVHYVCKMPVFQGIKKYFLGEILMKSAQTGCQIGTSLDCGNGLFWSSVLPTEATRSGIPSIVEKVGGGGEVVGEVWGGWEGSGSRMGGLT